MYVPNKFSAVLFIKVHGQIRPSSLHDFGVLTPVLLRGEAQHVLVQCRVQTNMARPNCLEKRNRFPPAYGNSAGTPWSRPLVAALCTCRKQLILIPLPASEGLVWTIVREWKGVRKGKESLKRYRRTPALLHFSHHGIHLSRGTPKAAWPISQGEQEKPAHFCHNKEQQTETEWVRGHTHCTPGCSQWPLHSVQMASTFRSYKNSVDRIWFDISYAAVQSLPDQGSDLELVGG